MALEHERKYEFAGPLPTLAGAGPVATERALPVRHLVARYYDTEDGRLAAAGITLRRRTGGEDAGWHLKLPVGDGVREEIHAPLTDRDEGPPSELTALVRSRLRHATPRPVIDLITERRPTLLAGVGGAPLAEAVLDRVTASRDGRITHWSEVEVELAPAQNAAAPEVGDAVLDAVEQRLTAVGARRSDAPSKLVRALAETGGAPTPPPAPPRWPADSAAAHVLDYARRQVDAILTLDPAVRRDLPDAVHRMRVASRRLRALLRSARAVLDQDVTDHLAAELRHLGAELGVDRDREVLTERLTTRLDELPEELRVGPVAERLAAWDRERRAESRALVVRLLDSPRHLDLLDALHRLLADPPLRPRAAERPARKVLAKAMRRDRDRLARRLRAAYATPAGPDHDAALHAARKAAKRARYAAEAAVPAVGKPARRQAKRCKALQRALGDHQDSVVARAALRELADLAQEAGEPSFSYGVLHEREAAVAADRARAAAKLPVG
ncbi:CYTH and CHAD domain-containing protein [Streptomyces millisiae]|uniref:CYTH and CHAD domain-containing protein n=1 Tax=Streptomyces millisiae TaxID=3075542 RepID=A0ABU2LYK5_9ACTN|nr:CYTH and CHAD domain-containing protein [Streptomyces sp. DSM 44918]MDT0322669.1 CYTH and CHAD domain-containing protein [Streptomyces sp. DSM 44918]